MAPEIANGEGATLASDVYSFGVLLFELLTLEKPFKKFSNCSRDEFMEGVFGPRRYRPSLSTNNKPSISSKMIHDLITNCWDHNPKNRPTMKTVVNILRVETIFLTNNGSSRRSDDIVSSCIMTSALTSTSSSTSVAGLSSSTSISSSSLSLSSKFGFGSGFGFGSQSSFDSTNTSSSVPKTKPTTARPSSLSSYKSYGSMKSFANKTRNKMQQLPMRRKSSSRENFEWTNQQQQQTTTTTTTQNNNKQQPQQSKNTISSSGSNDSISSMGTTTIPKNCRTSLLYSSVFGKVGNKDCLRRRSSLSSLSSFDTDIKNNIQTTGCSASATLLTSVSPSSIPQKLFIIE